MTVLVCTKHGCHKIEADVLRHSHEFMEFRRRTEHEVTREIPGGWFRRARTETATARREDVVELIRTGSIERIVVLPASAIEAAQADETATQIDGAAEGESAAAEGGDAQ